MAPTDVDRLVLTKARLLAEEGIERARVYTQGHPDAERLKAMAVVALDLCDRVEQAWADAAERVTVPEPLVKAYRFMAPEPAPVAAPEPVKAPVAPELPRTWPTTIEMKQPWYRRML